MFFCGAGISFPAGLPSFKGLVDEIYGRVGTVRNAIEQKAYERHQFDATLDLLERRLPGQRLAVRTALADALQPKLRRKGAKDTHTALLELARSRDGALRLVTTNYDRIFARLTKRSKPTVAAYAAPLLPIPKKTRWNGLVYLHGLLPEDADASALNRLVVTSGDFGLAYLTERWAARFVSELFRNYIVCFVGYSINDPVLRYMMDALAADRMLGEITPQAFALADCMLGREEAKTTEWEAKGATPILYEVPESGDHSALHRTLKAWADTYRDGLLGTERIVVDYAMTRPAASTRQDDFVGRMLWALAHHSGLPAKRFADLDPVPPLDWLNALSTERYGHLDLTRFNVPLQAEVGTELTFSLIRRPAPCHSGPWMMLASSGTMDAAWDAVMFHLARWLVRHLDDPALILWLAKRGGQPHSRLVRLIEDRLDTIARLEQEDGLDELARIRTQAPNAIPRPLLRPVWRLFLAGRVKSPSRSMDLYSWRNRLLCEGLTVGLRMELRELLAPRVTLREPFRLHGDDPETEVSERLELLSGSKDEPECLEQLLDWELVLAADHVQSAVSSLTDTERWRIALPALIEDFQQLLRDALDLMRELGKTDDCNDHSHWYLPSITPHWQNRHFRDWVTLIELVRDAWLALRENNPVQAVQVARGWFDRPHSTFKRLALFAASQDDCIAPDQWVQWLVADDAWWLWSVETGRETLRLLVLQGQHLTPQVLERLEMAILAGPPRSMFKRDLEPESWRDQVEHSIWLHLAKLQSSAVDLSSIAEERLAALSAAHPEWELASNESDEFSIWMSGTGDPDFKDRREVELAPRKRSELVDWLKLPKPTQSFYYEDTWREACRKHLLNTGYALWDLSREGHWPTERWREALLAWSEKRRAQRSWHFFAQLVRTMPDEVLQEIVSGMSWWLRVVSRSLDRDEAVFFDLCRRIMVLSQLDGNETGQPVARAINHPIGHITQALLNLWLRPAPNDNDGLPTDLEPFFTELCDTGVARFRHGRVLLASRLVTFYRVDQSWTKAHLLPLLEWQTDAVEARAAWEGFLWSPRRYPPLLIAFKSQLLDTARHYPELGEHARNFAAFVTYAALDPVDPYTAGGFQEALGALPPEGLQEVAKALVRALNGSGDQREEYWTNRVQPFWHGIWPKSRLLATKSIAETLAQLSIAARGQFPAALATVADWLQPIEHTHFVVSLLRESGLPGRFPENALHLLDAIIDDRSWPPRELGQCLTSIAQDMPDLQQDHRYQRLADYCRKHDIRM